MEKEKSENLLLNTSERGKLFSRKYLLPLLTILLITLVVFIPSLNNELTDKDDQEFLVDEPLVRSLNYDNAKELVLKYKEEPISHLVWLVEYQFFNQNPIGYHISSLIIHLLNIMLVFYLLALFTGNLIFLVTVTFVFALHPLHVEPVCWISGKTHLLFGLFFISGLIAYFKYLSNGFNRKYYAATVIFLFLGLFAYAPALSFIPVVFLLDYYFKRRFDWRVFADKVPYVVLSVLYLVIIVQLRHDEAVQFEDYSIMERIQVNSYALLFYLYKFLIPVNLSNFYPYVERVGGQLPAIFGYYPIIILILAAGVLYSLKYTRYLFLGFAFYFFITFPTLRWIPLTHPYMMADRYTYISYLALAGLVAGMIIYLRNRNPSKMIQGGSMILLAGWFVLMTVLSWERTKVWKNTETMWSDVVQSYPNVALAHYNRAHYLDLNGQYELAIRDYTSAIHLDSTYFKAYYNRARLYERNRQYRLALYDIDKAIELNPLQHGVYGLRGNIYYSLEDYFNAVENFNAALQLEPDNFTAYYNRGNAFYMRGELPSALLDYNRALQINPSFVAAYVNRSIVHDELGEKRNAWNDALKAKELGFDIDQEFLDRLEYDARMENRK